MKKPINEMNRRELHAEFTRLGKVVTKIEAEEERLSEKLKKVQKSKSEALTKYNEVLKKLQEYKEDTKRETTEQHTIPKNI
ncbi:hypothetical protein NHP190012_16880 (plasmid) [Helicobacter sp. NHP19-012]|uniref:Uncharacterized protein n=1 Tax=Helicobacter gastrofelis TaxID=2849642 RepID=A0ABM7SGL2_9HELI|nr:MULTISPECIES: hypothetical protein [unclassified Helicobacter]BCZ20046.1 hypothetical protein NHP190012_16880 [Helicobacter sp. NHP19-012]GMB96938.1 hypothetical protein NHP22001_15280 [Helicobacter sp. NHP22-001]